MNLLSEIYQYQGIKRMGKICRIRSVFSFFSGTGIGDLTDILVTPTLAEFDLTKLIVNNLSEVNIYIKSVKLNCSELSKPFLNHADIMIGGELLFDMATEHNKKW